MMNLCKRGGLIRWILRYCNAATPSCVLWKDGCTHFPGFILKIIPNKLGFWNGISKNIQIYRSILVLIIFMPRKLVFSMWAYGKARAEIFHTYLHFFHL